MEVIEEKPVAQLVQKTSTPVEKLKKKLKAIVNKKTS